MNKFIHFIMSISSKLTYLSFLKQSGISVFLKNDPTNHYKKLSVKKEDGRKATIKYIDGQVRLGGIGAYLGDKIYIIYIY